MVVEFPGQTSTKPPVYGPNGEVIPPSDPSYELYAVYARGGDYGYSFRNPNQAREYWKAGQMGVDPSQDPALLQGYPPGTEGYRINGVFVATKIPDTSGGGGAEPTYTQSVVTAADAANDPVLASLGVGTTYQRSPNGGITIISESRDKNQDGLDDKTGLALGNAQTGGVVKIGEDYYVGGQRTTPQGAPIEPSKAPYGTVTVTENGIRRVYAKKADETLGDFLYNLDVKDVSPATGGGIASASQVVVPYSNQLLAGSGGGGGGGGGGPMSSQDEVALINAKVNAAKAYAEALMAYDPTGYSNFLSSYGGGSSLANAINSGNTAITARSLKPAQDILTEIGKLNRMGGKPVDISGATNPLGGMGGGNIPAYAYGTQPAIIGESMMQGDQTMQDKPMMASPVIRTGGLNPLAVASNAPSGSGQMQQRPADWVAPTQQEQYDAALLRRANFMNMGPDKYTSIGEIPVQMLRRIQAGIANDTADSKYRLDLYNYYKSKVTPKFGDVSGSLGSYTDMNGVVHKGTVDYLSQFIAADDKLRNQLMRMSPEQLDAFNAQKLRDDLAKRQATTIFNAATMGGSVPGYGDVYGGGNGLPNATQLALNSESEKLYQQWLAEQRAKNLDNTMRPPTMSDYTEWLYQNFENSATWKDYVAKQKAQNSSWTYKPINPKIPAKAYGGLSTAKMAIVGDPQRDGGPNPEIIYNPTGAPFMVKPMKDMVPMYAYGTDTASTPDPYKIGDGTVDEKAGTYSSAEEARARGNRNQQSGTAEDPELTRLRAQYPWMNDPTYFMNVEFWKQDPILRDLYLKGLQISKGIPMQSVLASANINRLGGVSGGQNQVGW